MPSSDEVEKLREELAAREKEVDDLRTQAEMTESFVGDGEEGGARARAESTTEEAAAEKAALDERASALDERSSVLESREAALAKAEAELQQRKAEIEAAQASETKAEPATESPTANPSQDEQIATMEAKMNNLKSRANEKLKKIKADAEETLRNTVEEKDAKIAQLQQEVDRLQKEVERLQTEVEQVKQAHPVASALPDTGASDREIKDFIFANKTAMEIIDRNVRNKLEKERSTMTPTASADQEKVIAQKVEEATASVRAEQQQALEQKIEEARNAERALLTSRNAAKLSMIKGKLDVATAKWNVVATAAKETPEKAVKEVFDVASVAKPAPAAPKTEPTSTQPPAAVAIQPQTPAATVQPVSKQQSATTPAAPASAPLGQQQAAAGTEPQANGSTAGAFGQLPNNQSGFGNPFIQSTPQGLNQNQFGFGAQQQGGFGAPNPFLNQQHNSRPNSPFAQIQPQVQQSMQQQQPTMQTYQAPRGGAQNMNMRGQSGIPRGGSGIPVPGGGRGRGGPQQQQQQQIPVPNAGAQVNQQQFGRGTGGQRGGGGRGRGQQPGSPMNPGANTFVPGGAGGKGQKRGAEDDGTQQQQQQQRGKRHRGGRGGGGAGAGGDGTAAE